MAKNYSEYFDIDQEYFPQINDSSIKEGEKNNPDFWMRTYPHKTFVELLQNLEKVLSRTQKKTLWIEGAYGSGKSQCAYTLRRLLEASEEKFQEYWQRDALTPHTALRDKLLTHKKNKNIVTAFRYGSGDVTDIRNLFFKIQETLTEALKAHKIKDLGHATWREATIKWLEDEAHKKIFNVFLETSYSSNFSQRSADEVLKALRSSEASELMGKILRMGEAENLGMFKFDDDRFFAWVKEIFDKNPDLCVVFVWDEFGDFFVNNANSLTSFQRMVELCVNLPFYFIGVTHGLEDKLKELSKDPSLLKVLDRILTSKIELPDNIAFELIGEAVKVAPTMKKKWALYAEDLNQGLSTSRAQVMKVAKITDAKVVTGILPIHPMTALILKNIAVSFQSNQRSMFDFVKTEDPDVQAFQWYVQHYGPNDSNYRLLTVDLLWNFFYERGKGSLDPDIRTVLSSYDYYQERLNDEERRLMKTLLILIALDKEHDGEIALFKTSVQNLSLAFENIPKLENAKAGNLALGLVDKGILQKEELNDKSKTKVFRPVMVDTGLGEEISRKEKEIREKLLTTELVSEGRLELALSLPWSHKLRFDPTDAGLVCASWENFTKRLNETRQNVFQRDVNALLCYAFKQETAARLQPEIEKAAKQKDNEKIVLIDATSSFLSEEQITEYVSESARAAVYSRRDGGTARNHASKAEKVLTSAWKNQIASGSFVIYYDGERYQTQGLEGVRETLQKIVRHEYPRAFEFTSGLSENMLKATQVPSSVKCGITRKTSGVVGNIEKKLFANCLDVWTSETYWDDFPSEPISIVKRELDQKIKREFEDTGAVSIEQICDWLAEYGFIKSNLYAFLVGFLLREYAYDPSLRYSDSLNTQEEMTPEKLAEAVGNHLLGKAKRSVRIILQTNEERAFYDLLMKSWGAPRSTSTPAQATSAIQQHLLRRGLPLRFIQSQVDPQVFEIVMKFVDFCQKSGSTQMEALQNIGTQATTMPNLANELTDALHPERFQKGALDYLRQFDGGKLWEYATAIGAEQTILDDVRKKFSSVQYNFLWNEETQDDQILLLELEYQVVNLTKEVFDLEKSSLTDAYVSWKRARNNVKFSSETIAQLAPELGTLVKYWRKIVVAPAGQVNILLPDELKEFADELEKNGAKFKELIFGDFAVFNQVYRKLLEELPDAKYARNLYRDPKILANAFDLTPDDCNLELRREIAKIEESLMVDRLLNFWKEKTGTDCPRAWSRQHETPIMSLVPDGEDFSELKQAFDTVNNARSSDQSALESALAYLEKSAIFENLNDQFTLDQAFHRDFYGDNKLFVKYIEYSEARAAFMRQVPNPDDWLGNRLIMSTMEGLLHRAYEAEGKHEALNLVEKLSMEELKAYVVRLIESSPKVGMEILAKAED